mgnify:FL=1
MDRTQLTSQDTQSIALAILFAAIAIPAMAGASRRDEEGRIGDSLMIVGIVILVGIGFVVYNGGI